MAGFLQKQSPFPHYKITQPTALTSICQCIQNSITIWVTYYPIRSTHDQAAGPWSIYDSHGISPWYCRALWGLLEWGRNITWLTSPSGRRDAQHKHQSPWDINLGVCDERNTLACLVSTCFKQICPFLILLAIQLNTHTHTHTHARTHTLTVGLEPYPFAHFWWMESPFLIIVAGWIPSNDIYIMDGSIPHVLRLVNVDSKYFFTTGESIFFQITPIVVTETKFCHESILAFRRTYKRWVISIVNGSGLSEKFVWNMVPLDWVVNHYCPNWDYHLGDTIFRLTPNVLKHPFLGWHSCDPRKKKLRNEPRTTKGLIPMESDKTCQLPDCGERVRQSAAFLKKSHVLLYHRESSYIIHHTSYIIHHTSYTIHHTSYIIIIITIMHHASCIMHPPPPHPPHPHPHPHHHRKTKK